MRNVHSWKHMTEEREQREVRASKFSKEWRFQSKLRHDEVWTYHDVPLLEDLEALHDILFRKYQRKRLAYDDVAAIEKMLKERRAAEPALPVEAVEPTEPAEPVEDWEES
jgi:hypothetical protein